MYSLAHLLARPGAQIMAPNFHQAFIRMINTPVRLMLNRPTRDHGRRLWRSGTDRTLASEADAVFGTGSRFPLQYSGFPSPSSNVSVGAWKNVSLGVRSARLRWLGSACMACHLRRGNGRNLGQAVVWVEVINRTRRYQLMFHKHRWRNWTPIQNIQADPN